MKRRNARARQLRRTFALENLEGRSLPAGNITAVVDAGILKIRGDEAANGLNISQLVQAPTATSPAVVKWTLTGTSAGGADTTINGKSDPMVVTGPLAGIGIELLAGADSLTFTNPAGSANAVVGLSPRAEISLGDGADTVSGSIGSEGVVKFALGGGADTLSLTGSKIKSLGVMGDAPPEAKLEAGADKITLSGVIIGDAFNADLGGGDDTVEVGGASQLLGGVNIGLGAGADTVKFLGSPTAALPLGKFVNLNGGEGNDTINVNGVSLTGKMAIASEAGDDTVSISNSLITDGTNVMLGEGNDTFTGNTVRGPWLGVALGGGNDQASFTGEGFGSVKVLGDAPPPPPGSTIVPTPGSDTIRFENALVNGEAGIDAGPGDDGVTVTGTSQFKGGLNVFLGGGVDSLNIAGSADTTVAPLQLRGLNIGGGEGADTISVSRVKVLGRVNVSTDQGDDVVTFASVEAVEGIFAALGDGSDKFNASGILTANFGAILGGGSDSLNLSGKVGSLNIFGDVPPPPPTPAAGTVVAPTPGEDTVVLQDLLVSSFSLIDLGGGADSLTISGASKFTGGVGVLLGEGNDTVSITGTATSPIGFGRGLNLNGGLGNDQISVENVNVTGILQIAGEAGDDTVSITNATATEGIGVFLGLGQDTLSVKGSSAKKGVFQGGDGDADTNNDLGGNNFTELVVGGFENPPAT